MEYDERVGAVASRRLVLSAWVCAFVVGGCRAEVGGGGADMAMGGGDMGVTMGASDRFLLVGTILTPDQVIDGEVLVEADRITCVEAGTACESRSTAMGATVITTNGIIAPGMIDTHNHILFDVFNGDD